MGEHEVADQPRDHFLSNGAYDATKFVAQILLPALGTLYFALAAIWSLPAAEQVNGSILAVDAFLGVILGLSSASYKNSDSRFDGVIHVKDTPEKKTFNLELASHPDDLDQKDEVTFKVKPS